MNEEAKKLYQEYYDLHMLNRKYESAEDDEIIEGLRRHGLGKNLKKSTETSGGIKKSKKRKSKKVKKSKKRKSKRYNRK